ncbi:MAG TPA: AI-2E family transporter [Hyphomonadaceae bacterium]|nr:AI-2E family transporter [Hyphomonadaceae bacterium]
MTHNNPTGAKPSFVGRALIVFGFLILGLLLREWARLVLLVLSSILLAILLRALSDLVAEATPLGPKMSLVATCLAIFAALIAMGWLFGSSIAGELKNLGGSLGAAWTWVKEHAAGTPLESILRSVEQSASSPDALTSGLGGALTQAYGVGRSAIAVGTEIVIVVFSAIYLAFAPHIYRDGVLRLVPGPRRKLVSEMMEDSRRALQRWIVGQGISMTVVGLCCGVGVWLIGLPSPLALGLIAGLAEFIPFFGTIIGLAPALLLALMQGPETAALTIALYLVVQQIESNLLTPLVQQHQVSLPPALLIFSVAGFATLFGPLGALLATPIAVVIAVVVERLYVGQVLKEKARPPGASAA